MPLLSFRLTVEMLEEMDELRDSKVYPSRAELIRTAIQWLLNEEQIAAKWGKDTPVIAEQT